MIKNLVAILLLATCAHTLSASDWPQFRGPDGQGHADPADLPLEFGEDKNLAWKTEIPGLGWSSPVIAENKIWFTTAEDEGRSLRAIAVDPVTGKIHINEEVFRMESAVVKHAKNSYASPTPVLEPGRVYVSFGTAGTACLSAETGKPIWKNNELKIDHEVGPGSSPTIYNNYLLLHFDGTDHQYVVAFDKATGKIAWKTNRPSLDGISGEMRKAFCTPLVIEAAGRKEMISVGAQRLVTYDPDTGKELWRVNFAGFSNVPRPVYNGELVFISTGFNPPHLLAIRPGGNGDVTETHVAWKTEKGAPTNPSPIILGERLYMVSDRGVLTALEAKTGKELWRERLEGQFSASPIATGKYIYWCSEEGNCYITEDAAEYKLLFKTALDGQILASPAVWWNDLFIRTDKHLYKFGNNK